MKNRLSHKVQATKNGFLENVAKKSKVFWVALTAIMMLISPIASLVALAIADDQSNLIDSLAEGVVGINDVELKALLAEGIIDELTPLPIEIESLERREEGGFAYISDYTGVIIPEYSDGLVVLSGNDGRADIYMGIATTEEVEGILIDDHLILYEGEGYGITVEVFEGGIRQTFVIERSDSPTYFVVEYDLPEGAYLAFSYGEDGLTDGSVLLHDGQGDTFGAIDIPWAKDVTGEIVPTYFEIDGNRLIQHVHHSDAFMYPIVADPTTFSTHFRAGYWSTRGGWTTLNLTPTLRLRARGLVATGNFARRAFSAVVVDSWNQVVRRHRGQRGWTNTAARNNSMFGQYVCHFYFGWFDAQWNLELWRPHVSTAAMIRHRCNPPRAAGPR